MNSNKKVGIAYVPVLHKGYLNYFDSLKKEGVNELYLISDDILEAHKELDYINRKDRLRALPQELLLKLTADATELEVKLLTRQIIETLQKEEVTIVTPREDIGRIIVREYFPDNEVEYSDVFLRRNNDNIGEDKVPKETASVSLSDIQKKLFKDVLEEAALSADWWRQIGGALVKDGEVISIAHNEHMPEEQLPNIIGDSRSIFKRGTNINYVTTAHVEGALIADAAKRGIRTEGAELYITDFPCPYCARMIAKSGIRKIYFIKGYAVLDGDDFLKEEEVEVVKVKL